MFNRLRKKSHTSISALKHLKTPYPFTTRKGSHHKLRIESNVFNLIKKKSTETHSRLALSDEKLAAVEFKNKAKMSPLNMVPKVSASADEKKNAANTDWEGRNKT